QELQEDLDRHLNHLPLRHAPEPSLSERAGKWMRRHPRLVCALAAACAVSVLILAPVAYLWAREQHLIRHAWQTRDEFRAEFKAVQGVLNARNPLRQQLEDGIHRGRQLLDRYQVLDNPHDWRTRPAACRLSPDDKARLTEDMEELLLLVSRA